jgi:hypothetical protein
MEATGVYWRPVYYALEDAGIGKRDYWPVAVVDASAWCGSGRSVQVAAWRQGVSPTTSCGLQGFRVMTATQRSCLRR